MKKIIVIILIILIVLSLGFFRYEGAKKFEHHGLLEQLHENEQLQSPIDTQISLDTSAFVKVDPNLQSVQPFYTEMRVAQITSYPCSNCHSDALSELQSNKNAGEVADELKLMAHWDIQLNHGGSHVMNCLTCHSSDNFDQLKYLSDINLDFNQSFMLCGQCHNSQYLDWQGGAHGKALSGWGEPRQVKTCVSCHNPHEPMLEKRWPSRLNKKL